MNKKTIYIPIEIKARELSSQVLLAKSIVRLGCRVCIGSKPVIFSIIEKKPEKGGVLLYKGGMGGNTFRNFKKKLNAIAVLDQEISPALENLNSISNRFTKSELSYVDRLYYVGGKFGNFMIDNVPNTKDKVRNFGWPRIDLWTSKLKNFWNEDINNIREKYGSYILFSSDFGVLNEQGILLRIDQARGSQWDQDKKPNLNKLEADMRKILIEFNDVVGFLVELDKNLLIPPIIVRPHPAEDHKEWQRVAKIFNRIKVIYKGDVSPWIYAASAVLHRGCTSAVQAYTAGIPTGYIVSREELIKQTLPYQVSEHLYSAEGIANFCKKYIDHKPVPPYDYSEVFKNMIRIDKDKLASELIAEDMLNLISSPEPPYQADLKDVAYDALSTIYSGLRKAKQRLFKTEQIVGTDSKSRKMPGGITKKEVEGLLRRLDPDRQFIVRQVIRDCVEIEG
jgi:surface carbohydrate biosynthesis protein